MFYIYAITILNVYKIISYTLYGPYKRRSDRLRELLKKTRFQKTFQNIQRRHALLALLLLYQKEVTRQKKDPFHLGIDFACVSRRSRLPRRALFLIVTLPHIPTNSYKKEENMKEKRRDGRKGRINPSHSATHRARMPSLGDLPVFEARQILIPLLNTCTRNRKSN